MRPIFTLFAASRSGKSEIIKGLLERFPDRLEFIRSITTRPERGPEDERPDAPYEYRYVSDDEFSQLRTEGRLVQEVEYAGTRYGNDRGDVDDVLGRAFGLCTLVPQGIRNFRGVGYDVRIIRVTPHGNVDLRTPERRAADDAIMAAPDLTPNFTVMNDFSHPHGLAKAVDEVAMWIALKMGTYDSQQHLRGRRKPHGRW